jgi:hypothetical protein
MTKTDREFYRALPFQELMRLADMANDSSIMNPREAEVRNMLNDEVERRINNWEIAEV